MENEPRNHAKHLIIKDFAVRARFEPKGPI
jgi:hypothetical protein